MESDFVESQRSDERFELWGRKNIFVFQKENPHYEQNLTPGQVNFFAGLEMFTYSIMKSHDKRQNRRRLLLNISPTTSVFHYDEFLFHLDQIGIYMDIVKYLALKTI